MFFVGQKYKTLGGHEVDIVAAKYQGTAYSCVQGNDGVWRYNREGDMGRVTGSGFDMRDPNNLVPNCELTGAEGVRVE